jgi:hypothetical protein
MITVIFSKRPCSQSGIDSKLSCGYIACNTSDDPDREQAVERDLQQSGGIGAVGMCQCCHGMGTIEWIERT